MYINVYYIYYLDPTIQKFCLYVKGRAKSPFGQVSRLLVGLTILCQAPPQGTAVHGDSTPLFPSGSLHMQTRRAEKIQHLFCILGQQEEEHGIGGGNSGSTVPLLYSSHAYMQEE